MKILNILFVCLLIVSCKQKEIVEDETTISEISNNQIQEGDVSKIKYTEYVLSPETKDVVQNWSEYTQLQEQVNYVKKGNLSYFENNKETIEALFKGLYANIPEKIKENSILARVKALETKFFKLESLVNLSTTTKTELQNGIHEFLIAVTNLDLQMNKIIELESQNIVKP